MRENIKKNSRKIPVEIEFTSGYEQRFTAAILKIYSDRKRMVSQELKDKEQTAS